MWHEIFTDEAKRHIMEVTRESADLTEKFFDHVESRNTTTEIIELAKVWSQLDRRMQASYALSYVGMYQMSRFIILMNHLSGRVYK